MSYRCQCCGAAFDEPDIITYREDMNGEGAYQAFYIAACPDCGDDYIEESETLL